MQKAKILEKDIQKVCIKLFRDAGFFVFRHNPTKISQGRFFPVSDSEKGVPDMIGLFKGIFCGIEFKAPGKKQSEWQKQREKDIISRGGIYQVIDDIGDALGLIYFFTGRVYR